MSQAEPILPSLPDPDDGIPAADPGAGAPPPAEGFGVGGEEPDRPPEHRAGDDGAEEAAAPSETVFRPPHP